ncbi:DUF4921 family protein [Roseiconus nitratireducens]|uniref:DUF4921 family protein n=1 Tax=Roseiconus nitratireducens TaxID=2605748 RepID=A0A5M6CWI1_9BACT|nr:DUF4921 family protein [Roseiconus nitratireducens]KAA5539326.1 DUF4921 family protein [Roseiconus nitratireducens]
MSSNADRVSPETPSSSKNAANELLIESRGRYVLAGKTVSAKQLSDQDTHLASACETKLIWQGRSGQPSIERMPDRRIQARINQWERDRVTASHSRRDLLTGDWTIFAPERDQRPNDYAILEARCAESEHRTVHGVDPDCPFCRGAESETPKAVWSAKRSDELTCRADDDRTRLARPAVEVRPSDQPDWDIRVVPNKFPAVSPFDTAGAIPQQQSSFFPVTDTVGGHEVMIESSEHAELITQLDASFLYMTLLAYRDRIRHWRQVPGIEYISVFKNCGPDAGASLRHSHSQLIATSLMPQRVRTVTERCQNYRARTGCALGCDLLRAELNERTRVIDHADSFVAFCPFASRFPGLVRVTSTMHQPHFDDFSDNALDNLASFLWRVLGWVDTAFPGKAYNYLLHTCPPGIKQPDAFHWSLDVFPRLSKTAGFEWSSDCMINSMLPEDATDRYREAAFANDPRHVLAIH